MKSTNTSASLLISQGSPFIFFTRPISAVLMVLAILSIGRGIWVQLQTEAPEVALMRRIDSVFERMSISIHPRI